MRRLLPLLAAVCLSTFAAPPAMAQSNTNEIICAADDDSAFAPAQRIAACTALIAVAKDAPQDVVTALVNRGTAYYYLNKMPLAFADFDRAIALDPKNARAFRERSNSHRTAGRLDRALADANEAVRLDPKDAKAFDNRGNVFNNNRQYDRAIDDYNEAIRLDPKFAQAFMDRGVANYFKQDYQSAIKDYDEAIKLNPRRARAYTNRGAAYKKLGRLDRAIEDDSEAIKLDPAVPEYFDNRGLSYQENGDYDRAIADYDRALKLNPGFTLAYHNRAAAFRGKGDLDRAIADYEQVLRVDPQMDSAAAGLAAVRQERDRRANVSDHSMLPTFDCAAARRAVEKAICSDPDLSRLDRQIDDAYKAALAKLDRKGVARLRGEQRDFNINRNTAFGQPSYQLKHELERRLAELRLMAGGR